MSCCPTCKRPLPNTPRDRALNMVAGKGATPRQLDTLTAVLTYTDQHGMPPTYVELGKLIGASKITAWEHVQAMERKGVLRLALGVARAIRV